MSLNVDDVVLCKVTKIEGTTVFLDVEDSKDSGTMMLSEVAAGRIRNLRDYVSVNRKIVCKVLKISSPGHFEFSLRRVTARERDDVLERYKKERAFANMLKVAGEKPDEVIAKVRKDYDMLEFFDEVREDPKLLEKYLSKEKAEKVAQIISEKEEREKRVESVISLKSSGSSGVEDIKEILNIKDVEIHYLGSSRFSVSMSAGDFKEASHKMEGVLSEIEERAKKKGAEFEVVKREK
jgi:translation initiation factor 2 alpha subunit (eIF-2alpha)